MQPRARPPRRRPIRFFGMAADGAPGPIYHRLQRHALRNTRKETATHDGVRTKHSRDTLIHNKDHPHLTYPRSGSSHNPYMRMSPPQSLRGLDGLARSVTPERLGSQPRPVSRAGDLSSDHPWTQRAKSPVSERRSVSPPNVFSGKFTLSRQEKKQREHQNVLRVIQQAMAAKRSLHGQSLSDSRAVFSAMDRDSAGTVDQDEFAAAMRRLGLGLTAEQVHTLAQGLDRDNDGVIDYEELLSFLHGDAPIVAEEVIDPHDQDQRQQFLHAPLSERSETTDIDAKSSRHQATEAEDRGCATVAMRRCTYVTGAFVVGFCTAIAIVMLLGSEIVGVQSLRRGILRQMQKPGSYEPTEVLENMSAATRAHMHHLHQQPPLAIIGGSGAEAGLDLASKVVVASQRQMAAIPGYEAIDGDLAAPRFTLLSVPELGLSMNLELYEAQVWTKLRDAYLELANAPGPQHTTWTSCSSSAECTTPADVGADRYERAGVVAIACVTLAYFEPQLEQLRAELLHSPLRMLSAVPPKVVSSPAAISRRLAARVPPVQTVALLGSKLTLDIGPGGKSPFICTESARNAADRCGDWVYEVPDPAAQERLQALIFSIKRGQSADGAAARYKEYLRDQLLELIDGLSSELVVLACTELPLVLTEQPINGEIRHGEKTLLDATAVLAQELTDSVLPVQTREATQRNSYKTAGTAGAELVEELLVGTEMEDHTKQERGESEKYEDP